MSLTFRDIEGVRDDEQFVMSGKDLKDLLNITCQVRSGPDRIHFVWGGQLTKIVCGVDRMPDIEKLLNMKTTGM